MSPVPAKPSATIVVTREGASSPQILLVRRRAGDAFGGSYAFPGGVVDYDESHSYAYSPGVSPDDANATLSIDQGGLDYYSAAIRELFEETGILLARKASGDWAIGLSDLDVLRKEIDKGTLPWSDFLRDQEIEMATDVLHYFAYWETPLELPKRWSTRFFIAELPPGQDANPDGSELTDCRWLAAADALARWRKRDIKLPVPTVSTLESLSGFNSIDGMIRWANERAKQGIERILPDMDPSDGNSKFVLPGASDT